MTSDTLAAMRAVMLEVPAELLAERRRLGHDCRDEVWDGVLHMVPQPDYGHQRFGTRLIMVLEAHAASRGLEVVYEAGLYRLPDGSDYRVPDLVVVDPVHASKRGIEMRAAIVIELLSPGDESREKLPFFARCGVSEVWFIDRKLRTVEIRLLRDGSYISARSDDPGDDPGTVRSEVLGLAFRTVAGPKLAITWTGGGVEL